MRWVRYEHQGSRHFGVLDGDTIAQVDGVPFDNPANLDFDGHGSLLVANQAFFSQRPDHWAVLAVWVHDKS